MMHRSILFAWVVTTVIYSSCHEAESSLISGTAQKYVRGLEADFNQVQLTDHDRNTKERELFDHQTCQKKKNFRKRLRKCVRRCKKRGLDRTACTVRCKAKLRPKPCYSYQVFNDENGEIGDAFGSAVAVSNDNVAVGAPINDASGSVFVYSRSGDGTWSLQAKIKGSDGIPEDRFGSALAFSGNELVVGAPGDWKNVDGNPIPYSADRSGKAYVFVRVGTEWIEKAILTPSDGDRGDMFGYSVTMSGDTIAVGSYRDDDNGRSSGSVYIFARDGDSFKEKQKLVPNDNSENNRFGISVSMYDKTLVVGADGDDDYGKDSGSAYVYAEQNGQWLMQQKILVKDTSPSGDRFGWRVSIHGKRFVVAAMRDDDKGYWSGSVYVYEFANGLWKLDEELHAENANANDQFGHSVSIFGDMIAVGVRGDEAETVREARSVQIFVHEKGSWKLLEKLKMPNGKDKDDFFGDAVAVYGNTVAVGADSLFCDWPGAADCSSVDGTTLFYTFSW